MKTINSPIAIFCYKRLDTLKTLISQLRSNKLFLKSEIFFFVDGPRNEKDFIKIKQIHRYVKNINHPSKKIILRKKNLGLAKSIISGINYVFKKYDKIIVLEDDISISNDFLSFMNQSLNDFKNHDNIISVNAHHFTGNYNFDFLFYHFSCWGWGTWKDRWADIEWDVNKLLDSLSLYQTLKFNIYGFYPYKKMLIRHKRGYVNSWFIRFYANSILKNKLSYYSGINLASHNGYDKYSTHCDDFDFFRNSHCSRNHSLPFNKNSLVIFFINLGYIRVFFIQKFYRLFFYISSLSRFKFILKKIYYEKL